MHVVLVAVSVHGAREGSDAKAALVALLRLNGQDELLVAWLVLLVNVPLELIESRQLQPAVLADEPFEMCPQVLEEVRSLAVNLFADIANELPVTSIDVSLQISFSSFHLSAEVASKVCKSLLGHLWEF